MPSAYQESHRNHSQFSGGRPCEPTPAAVSFSVRCYGSQTAQFRYDRAIRGLNQYRGALAARCPYAEVFQSAACMEETRAPTGEGTGLVPGSGCG